MRISLYKNIKMTTPSVSSKCVFKVLESIKDGTYKTQVANIRLETDKTKRNEAKQKIPYVTFGGTFSTRSNKNLKAFSGLGCLDFDDVKDLETLKDDINGDEYTFASFVSPSGNGLKVLVKMPPVDNNDDYQDYYSEITKHYSQYYELDESTKDLARACYVSFDEGLFLNAESQLFTEKFNRPLPEEKEIVNIPITESDEIAERLEKWFTKRWTGTNRNTNLHAYARQMNAFGVSKDVCEKYLLRYEQPGFKSSEIQMLIDSAYRYTTEFGSLSFEDSKQVNKVKNLLISGRSDAEVLKKMDDVDTERLVEEIKKQRENLNEDEFWFVDEKEKVHISNIRFDNYLKRKGISKYYPHVDSGSFDFIIKDENFVDWINETRIKDIVKKSLLDSGDYDIWDLMANNNQYFKRDYLNQLDTIDITPKRDTSKESFLYYSNKAVRTTKKGIELLDYKDIGEIIWRNQIIDREIKLADGSGGEFKTFIWRLAGENKERYFTLKSVIGYLLHSYQNDSKPKAIIFNDEMVSDDIPNGGSGKGLIHKAIGHIKNLVVEDGKKFDPRGQFAYQKVNKDTQIFLMDDVPRNFNFENLFSIVTEGMTVEKKGQDAFLIPFVESPKISITTNYTIKGEGASFYRRVFEVEIANHFNDNYTPEDEFKHQFFSEWDEGEWAEFDNFMIRCVKFYLENGLVESNKVNLEFRKFKQNMGVEFIEFMEGRTFRGVPVHRKVLKDDFVRQYPKQGRFVTAQSFNKKVKDYCSYKDFEFYTARSNNIESFYINEKKDGKKEESVLSEGLPE